MPKEVFILVLVAMVGFFGLVSASLSAFVKFRLAKGSPPRYDDRLAQIGEQLAMLQQSVDATAIEVERLGEGLRFTTKLLNERSPLPPAAPTPRQPERVVTPH